MVKIKYPDLYQHFDQWVHIPQEQWLEFESKFSEKTYAKGDFLIEAGDTKLELGFIVKGLFRLFYTDKNGKEQIKAFRKDHELVGAYAEMLLKIPSRTFVQAMEPSKVILMRSEDFFPFYERHACWQTLGRLVAEKHFLVKEQREFEFLQLDVLERYKIFRQEYGEIALKIPQHQVASYLGITPVALSRVLSKVRKKQLL